MPLLPAEFAVPGLAGSNGISDLPPAGIINITRSQKTNSQLETIRATGNYDKCRDKTFVTKKMRKMMKFATKKVMASCALLRVPPVTPLPATLLLPRPEVCCKTERKLKEPDHSLLNFKWVR